MSNKKRSFSSLRRNNSFLFILIEKYVVKVLMGGIDDWFDTLDERRVSGTGPSNSRRASKGKKKDSCAIL